MHYWRWCCSRSSAYLDEGVEVNGRRARAGGGGSHVTGMVEDTGWAGFNSVQFRSVKSSSWAVGASR